MDANTMEHTESTMRETNSLLFLPSSVSPAMVIAPPVENGYAPLQIH